jgi:hypothetical protein
MPLQQRWGRRYKGSNFIYRFLMNTSQTTGWFLELRGNRSEIPRAVEYHGQSLPMGREIENREVEAPHRSRASIKRFAAHPFLKNRLLLPERWEA